MKFDLRAPEDFPAHVRLEANAPEWDLTRHGIVSLGPLSVEMDIVKSDNVYYFTGTVESPAKLQCARCLAEFDVPLKGTLEFSVQEAADPQAVSRDEIPDTEMVIPVGQGEIELDGPIKEALILETPLKPLCRPDCRGLCPKCGIDLNSETCECKTDELDPRWEGLRQFR